jgi:hypothetical protein
MLKLRWKLGYKDRGMGRGDFAILTQDTEELVVECPCREVAEHLIGLQNQGLVLQENYTNAWAALAMVREALELYGPVQASEHAKGPEPVHEAELLVAAIQRLAKERKR